MSFLAFDPQFKSVSTAYQDILQGQNWAATIDSLSAAAEKHLDRQKEQTRYDDAVKKDDERYDAGITHRNEQEAYNRSRNEIADKRNRIADLQTQYGSDDMGLGIALEGEFRDDPNMVQRADFLMARSENTADARDTINQLFLDPNTSSADYAIAAQKLDWSSMNPTDSGNLLKSFFDGYQQKQTKEEEIIKGDPILQRMRLQITTAREKDLPKLAEAYNLALRERTGAPAGRFVYGDLDEAGLDAISKKFIELGDDQDAIQELTMAVLEVEAGSQDELLELIGAAVDKGTTEEKPFTKIEEEARADLNTASMDYKSTQKDLKGAKKELRRMKALKKYRPTKVSDEDLSNLEKRVQDLQAEESSLKEQVDKIRRSKIEVSAAKMSGSPWVLGADLSEGVPLPGR